MSALLAGLAVMTAVYFVALAIVALKWAADRVEEE